MLTIETTIRDRIWSILLDNEDVAAAFRVGNRINTSDPARLAKEAVKNSIGQPGDFPQLRVFVGADAGQEKPPLTFSDNGLDYGVPMRLSAEIICIYDKLGDNNQSPINDAIRIAILGAGTNLGINWISFYTIAQSQRDENSEITGNQRRRVVRIKLTINARPMLSWIIGTGSGS